ncbi:MAG: copper transport protein [Streptomyces sp.]|nr:copper transport protein [Streptomyces sp.]
MQTAHAGSRRTAVRRALVLLAALLAVIIGAAAPASAHAALLKTTPGEDSVVKTAPAQVELTFSEGVLLADDSIRVLSPDGRRADTGKPHANTGGAKTAAVALRSGLKNGTYTVAWKAVSADSHPVAGAFTFSIGAPSKTTVALPQQEAGGGVVGTLYGIARYISYSGYALLVGAAVFLGACWPRGATLRPMRRLVVGGWAAMVAATLALLMLRAPYANGGGLGDALDLSAVRDVLDTRPGAALLSRLLLLAAGAVFIAVLFGTYAKREDPVERQDLAWGLAIGGTVVAGGLAATWAMAEHASVGIQSSIAMPVDVLHLLAMAVWLGGLVALLTALFKGQDTQGIEREAVQRFSRIGFGAVVTLVSTGVYQSWRQVGSWNALVSTSYGQLLCVKVGLVVLLVELAWLSRRWTGRLGEAGRATATTAAAKVPVGARAAGGDERADQLARQEAALARTRAKKARDADPERTGLRKSVLAEVVVAVAVLAVTTVLTGTQPGRAATETTSAGTVTAPATKTPEPLDVTLPFDTGGPKGKGTAEITLDPATSGQNELHLLITGTDGKARDVPEVQVAFTLTAKKIGPLPVTLGKIDTGHWASTTVQLPMPGAWLMAVTVRTSDIDQITETKTVKIN